MCFPVDFPCEAPKTGATFKKKSRWIKGLVRPEKFQHPDQTEWSLGALTNLENPVSFHVDPELL